MNETLCRALLQARLTEEDVAAHLQVDPKTVRRWLEGRVPYLRHRWALATLLGLDEADLWPHLRTRCSRPDEVQAIYPYLDAVPEEVWLRMFGSAVREIGIMADDAQPIAEHPRVLAVLADKIASSVRVRICLPDLGAPAFAEHANAHESGAALASGAFRAHAIYAPLRGKVNVEIRLRRVIVYNAIYYADGEFLVAQHAHGVPDLRAPLIHLRGGGDGGIASIYRISFESVWGAARLTE